MTERFPPGWSHDNAWSDNRLINQYRFELRWLPNGPAAQAIRIELLARGIKVDDLTPVPIDVQAVWQIENS
jgi:hypothetical protein